MTQTIDILNSFRPVRALVVRNRLRERARLAQVLRLASRLFGGCLDMRGDDWYWLLGDMVSACAAAGLFTVDYATLDYLNECVLAFSDGDNELDEENFGFEAMALFLQYIPVIHYGFSEDDWINVASGELGPLCVVRAFVDEGFCNSFGISDWQVDVEVDVEVYENIPVEIDHLNIGTLHGYIEPLCWLPDVVRYCMRATGNKLLDTACELVDTSPLSFAWDQLPLARAATAAAVPIWRGISTWAEWAGDQENLGASLELLCWGDAPERFKL